MWMSGVNNHSGNHSDLLCFIFDTQRCLPSRIPKESMWTCKNLASLEKPHFLGANLSRAVWYQSFWLWPWANFSLPLLEEMQSRETACSRIVSHYPNRRKFAGCPAPPAAQAGQGGGLGKLFQVWQGGTLSAQRLTNEFLKYYREDLSPGTGIGTGDSSVAEEKNINKQKNPSSS